MSGNDELGDMIAELTRLQQEHESLKAMVREIVRISKCTDGECSNEAYMKMWTDLEELVK